MFNCGWALVCICLVQHMSVCTHVSDAHGPLMMRPHSSAPSRYCARCRLASKEPADFIYNRFNCPGGARLPGPDGSYNPISIFSLDDNQEARSSMCLPCNLARHTCPESYGDQQEWLVCLRVIPHAGGPHRQPCSVRGRSGPSWGHPDSAEACSKRQCWVCHCHRAQQGAPSFALLPPDALRASCLRKIVPPPRCRGCPLCDAVLPCATQCCPGPLADLGACSGILELGQHCGRTPPEHPNARRLA